MKITYDVATGELDFDIQSATPTGGQFQACINRYGRRITFDHLSFGLTVFSNDIEIASFTFPPGTVRYTQSDQDMILTDQVTWEPNDNIILVAFLDNARQRIERTWYLTAPLPPQPYPSWTWDGGAWIAPLPYPDDGREYTWNEDAQAWEAVV